MLLTLPRGSSFWGFGQIWIAFNNIPYEIDLDTIDPQTKYVIANSLKTGELVEIKTEEQRQAIEQQVAATLKPTKLPDILSVDAKKNACEFLKNGVATIRRDITRVGSLDLLKYMLQVEQKSRKRKKVVELIKERTSELKKDLALATGNYDDNVVDETEELVITRDIAAAIDDIGP